MNRLEPRDYGGYEDVFAIVDATDVVTEFDQSNNADSVRLFNNPCFGDVNSVGRVSIGDLL